MRPWVGLAMLAVVVGGSMALIDFAENPLGVQGVNGRDLSLGQQPQSPSRDDMASPFGSTLADGPEQLHAEVQELALRWGAKPTQVCSQLLHASATQVLWRETQERLIPWLIRHPRSLWNALPNLGTCYLDVGQALIAGALLRAGGDAISLAAKLAHQLPEEVRHIYSVLIDAFADRHDYPQAMQVLSRDRMSTEDRSYLEQRLMSRWAAYAPQQAALWAAAEPARAHWLDKLADRWAHTDSRAATAFAAAMPEREARKALLVEAFSRWLAQDAAGARQWLFTQSPMPDLDASLALRAASDELVRNDPLFAASLTARITDSHLRWQTWGQMARTLHNIDPGQVALVLQQNGQLSALDIERLLSEFPLTPVSVE